jgi:broad specificity phosphatase PhoE
MTDSTHLMFVRHGETVGNSEQIAHGRSESPLNDRGIQQAKSTAEMLNGWHRTYHRVYASPLSRAHDTGKHISEALQLPIHLHEGLQEGFLGDWEGVTYEQLGTFEFARRSIKDDDFRGHNGESPNQLARRVVAAVREIRSNHPGENIIVVSHGAAISHAMSILLGTRPVFGYQYLMHNSAVTEISFSPDPELSPELQQLNFHEHLPEHLKIDPVDQKT